MSYLTASAITLLIFTNIPGNILVILAVVLDPNKNLRTPFNWLVVNLAVADLFVGIIAQPLALHFHIKEGLEMNGVGGKESLAIHIVYFISCSASILSVSSLAVERYLAVRKPHTYRTNVTNKRVVLTIVIIWLISFSLPNNNLNVDFSTYAFVHANAAMAVGVIIICITYTLIKRKVGKSKMTHLSTENTNTERGFAASVIAKRNSPKTKKKQIMDERSQSISTTLNTSQTHFRDTEFPTVISDRISSNAIINHRQMVEAQVTKMFITVLIALVSLYGPSTIMMYIAIFCEDCGCDARHGLEDVSVLFTLMNSSINFFCYALRSTRFRNSFVKLLKFNQRRSCSTSFKDTIAMQSRKEQTELHECPMSGQPLASI